MYIVHATVFRINIERVNFQARCKNISHQTIQECLGLSHSYNRRSQKELVPWIPGKLLQPSGVQRWLSDWPPAVLLGGSVGVASFAADLSQIAAAETCLIAFAASL